MDQQTTGISSVNDRPQLKVLIALLLIVIVPIVRAEHLIVSPRLWAEDGRIFLTQAWNSPGLSNFLREYNGYLHTVPRLIAAVAVAFPLRWIPAIFLVFAWTGYAVPILILLYKDGIGSVGLRFCLCALYCAAPIGETFLNVTNMMWYMAPAAAIIISYPHSPKKIFRIAEDIFLALCSVTGPFSIFLLPTSIILLKVHKASERPVIFALGAAVQLWFLEHSPRTHLHGSGETGFAEIVPLLQAALVQKIYVPEHLFGSIAIWGCEAAVIAALIYGIKLAADNRQYLPFTMTVIVVQQLIALALTHNLVICPRYMLLPIMTALFTLGVTLLAKDIRRPVRIAAVPALFWMIVVPNQHDLPWGRSPAWSTEAALYARAPRGTIVHLIVLPTPKWYASLIKH